MNLKKKKTSILLKKVKYLSIINLSFNIPLSIQADDFRKFPFIFPSKLLGKEAVFLNIFVFVM